MSDSNTFVCTTCGTSYPLDTRDWRCSCGGLYDLETAPPFEASQIDAGECGLKRYQALLALDPAWDLVTLGEGDTPLVEADWEGWPLHLKLESQNPTGSFKDRGAATLVAALRGLGIGHVVEDSSGNAGASLAAYSARAGIECEICVPDSSNGPKMAQIAAYGAKVVQVRGRRAYAALAAWASAAHGTYYASHVYNPYFLAGIETIAYEIWEQLGHRAPAALIVPVGNGTLLLGAHRGFQKLCQAGEIRHLPQLFAVQSAACAPIYKAYQNGQKAIEPVEPGTTAASGISVEHPARGMQVLAAVQATEGAVVAVTEAEIERARRQLNGRGFYVEETSAAAIAALAKLRDKLQPSATGPWVVPLTGHGLKTA